MGRCMRLGMGRYMYSIEGGGISIGWAWVDICILQRGGGVSL